EEPVDRVAVAPVVLGCVDAALGGDGVGAPGAVVEGEGLHLVAQLAEGGGGAGAGQARPHDDDLEAAPVVGRHELHLELVLVPLLLDGTAGDGRVETDHRPSPGGACTAARYGWLPWSSITWACTMIGKEMLPTRMTAAKPV